MKKGIRVFLIWTVVFALFAGIGVSVGATEQIDGDFTYRINDDGMTVTVTGYTGSDTDIYIPQTIDGKSVTAIGDEAFCNNATIYLIDLQWVDSVGACAFYGCSSLKYVYLSNRLGYIGDNAFAETSLKYVYFDGSYTAWKTLESETSEGNKALFTAAQLDISGLYDGPFIHDITDDYIVDMNDALLVYQIAAGKCTPTRRQLDFADMNNSGEIDMIDALKYYGFASGTLGPADL